MILPIIKQIVQSRKKSLISLTVLFVLSLSIQFAIKFYCEPKLNELSIALQKQREHQGRGVALQSRDVLYKNGLKDLQQFNEQVYPKSNFARFIGELYNLAESNGIELTTISYKPTKNKDAQFLEFELAISANGTYLKLKKFIGELNTSSNLLAIDMISFSSKGASSDLVQLQMNITSYFRVEGT
jgi:type IV pilus assembly protein PilO